MAATTQHTTTGSTARSGTRTGFARRTFTEAKNGFKTSEFWTMIVAVAGLLYVTYVPDDSLADVDGWRFASWIVIAYIVSRGLAKLGSIEPYTERDEE
jgi:hypothetical protein